MKDIDHLLDEVARLKEYSEPYLRSILECLDSLNYRNQPKHLPKEPVAARTWDRSDCQKRRRLELKGLSPKRIADVLERPRYYKQDPPLYQCSCCTEVYHTWLTASKHWKVRHFGPIKMFCMSCGHQLPNYAEDKHESFCGWDVLETDVNKPGRIWLCCLQNLLYLKRREVSDLVHAFAFEKPSGRCDARALALSFFQQLRRTSALRRAEAGRPLSQVGNYRNMTAFSRTRNGALAGREAILAIYEWAIGDNSLMDRQLVVWDSEMFNESSPGLYLSEMDPGVHRCTGLAGLTRPLSSTYDFSQNSRVNPDRRSHSNESFSHKDGQGCPKPKTGMKESIMAPNLVEQYREEGSKKFNCNGSYEGASDIFEQSSNVQLLKSSSVKIDSDYGVVKSEKSTVSDLSDYSDSDGTSIAGSDVELREGVGQAWRSARKATQRYPGRYDEAGDWDNIRSKLSYVNFQ